MSTDGNLSNAPIFSAATPTRDYEFSADENRTFLALASSMRFVGGAQVVTGVLLFVIALAHVWMGGAPALVSSVPMTLTGAMILVTGVWLRRASTSVERVATTAGSDIQNLMESLGTLAQMFTLQRRYFIAVGVVAAVALVGVVVALLAFAEAFRTLLS
jgi:hypothetical protein